MLNKRERAGNKVATAKLRKVLVKPDSCSVCGRQDTRIVAHHTNYDEPLNVVWLCSSCHKKEHNRLRKPSTRRFTNQWQSHLRIMSELRGNGYNQMEFLALYQQRKQQLKLEREINNA
jgi:hypothetical protein